MGTRREREAPALPGADDVIAQLGEWPSFHDAEIVRVHIERDGRSKVTIMLTAAAYKQRRVTFTFERIADLSLGGEEVNVQNVIFGLHLEQDGNFTTVEFAPCYGLSGSIKAEAVMVSVE